MRWLPFPRQYPSCEDQVFFLIPPLHSSAQFGINIEIEDSD